MCQLGHWYISVFLNPLIGFLIDDHTLPSQSSYSHECGVGDQVNVVVAIRNSSGVSMAPSFLVFEPQFHSQQLKRLLKDVGHMILHSGSLIVGIPQVCVHVCTVLTARPPTD